PPYEVMVINPDGGADTKPVADVQPCESGCGSAPPSKTTASATTSPTPPKMTSLTPSAGARGSTVVISGSGFGSPATVRFAGRSGVTLAATVTQVTSGSITVTVPAQAATGSVTVAVNGVVGNSLTYTVVVPVLGAVSPASVSANPGAVTA